MSNPNGDGKDHQRIAFYLRMMEDACRDDEDKFKTVLEIQSRIDSAEELFFKDETLSRRLREMRDNCFVTDADRRRPKPRSDKFQSVKGWKLTEAGRRLASMYKPSKAGARAA